jgi:hypothetical protein
MPRQDLRKQSQEKRFRPSREGTEATSTSTLLALGLNKGQCENSRAVRKRKPENLLEL